MNIYVGNLSFSVTEEDLRTAFQAFGAVEKAAVITDKMSGQSRGFGFVEMPNKDEAIKAIEGPQRQGPQGPEPEGQRGPAPSGRAAAAAAEADSAAAAAATDRP